MWTFGELFDLAEEMAVEEGELYVAAWLASDGLYRTKAALGAAKQDVQFYDHFITKAYRLLSHRDREIKRLLIDASYNIKGKGLGRGETHG